MKKLIFQEINQGDVLIDTRSLEQGRLDHPQEALYFNATNFSKFAQDFIEKDANLIFITDSDDLTALEDFEKVAPASIKGYISADNLPAESKINLQTISAKDFLDLDGDYTLLDLRHPDEITRPAPTTHLVNIPLSDLRTDYEKLDANTTIYTLCGSGNRATTAASFLTDKGYDVKIIDGGIKAVNELRGVE